MVVKCDNVRIPRNVTDFGSITNGEIKITIIINAHGRKVLEVARSRISRHLLQKVVSQCPLCLAVVDKYVLMHLIRSV